VGGQETEVDRGARKRAAVEMIAKHEAALRRTARRYSLDSADAEDVYQRALEIVLTKAPTTDLRELIRWTQTVTKHEALAVRQSRERLLSRRRGYEEDRDEDPVALIPARTDSPDEQAERREEIARSREALQTLKPAELRALTLLAEGYSYAEIGELTGFSRTKTNRLLAEGRERFRRVIASGEDGSRCREMRPLLSAFCDGEASPGDAMAVREHLRACPHCRATMRAYRTAPRIAIALAPILPPPRSLLERAHEQVLGLASRIPGIGPGEPAAQVATAAPRGLGVAAMAKLAALCAGTAGGAACLATGVVPVPDLAPPQPREPTIERSVLETAPPQPSEGVQYEPAPAATPSERDEPKPDEKQKRPDGARDETIAAGGTEYEASPVAAETVAPEPEPVAPAPVPESTSAPSSGSAAGEFGP
jgi:RNA polymerase sigma factor (sigma-70 family)